MALELVEWPLLTLGYWRVAHGVTLKFHEVCKL